MYSGFSCRLTRISLPLPIMPFFKCCLNPVLRPWLTSQTPFLTSQLSPNSHSSYWAPLPRLWATVCDHLRARHLDRAPMSKSSDYSDRPVLTSATCLTCSCPRKPQSWGTSTVLLHLPLPRAPLGAAPEWPCPGWLCFLQGSGDNTVVKILSGFSVWNSTVRRHHPR